MRWRKWITLLYAFAGVACLAVPNPAGDKETTADQKTTSADSRNTSTSTGGSFTFAGVGDNLLHDTLFLTYQGDTYDSFYAPMQEIVENADLAYINFETVCAGEEYGLSGYPSFNGPTGFIDSMARTGFDWYSTSSNHSMDAGMDGLIHEMDVLEGLGGVWTGSHRSEEEAETPVVIDVNGVKVGVAGFTYGLNGYVKPEGADWLLDVFMDEATGTVDYDLLEKRISALQDVSDVQIVSIHWGDEYSNTPNAIQQEVAQWFNDHGVEVVIGTHPHVIQPAEIIHGENQDTLVYYSLGNFISAQDEPERMVGGLAQFTLDYDPATDKTTFSDVSFSPTVTWIRPDLADYAVYPFSAWTDEMAENHWVGSTGLHREEIQAYVQEVMGNPEGIEINL